MDTVPHFKVWLDDFLAAYYRRRPVNATFIGVHEFDHLLPDFSEAACAETLDEMEHLLQQLNNYPIESLNATERIDRCLAEGFLRLQDWEYRSNHFQRANPCVYTGEAIFGVMSLFLTAGNPLRSLPDRHCAIRSYPWFPGSRAGKPASGSSRLE